MHSPFILRHYQGSKACAADGGVHNGKASMSRHFFDDNVLLPPNSKNTAETSLVESVNFLLIHSCHSPYFAAVQYNSAIKA